MASIKTIIEIRNRYANKKSPIIHKKTHSEEQIKENKNSYPFLNIVSDSKGICLSEVQMDLISITEISSVEELLEYINNCRQIDYTDMELEYIKGLDLESSKREVFRKYQDSLLSIYEYAKDKMSFIRKKVENLGIPAVSVNEVSSLFSEGKSSEALGIIINRENIPIFKIREKFFSKIVLDRDDVKSSSYEEISNLGKNLKDFDCITISCENYDSIINGSHFDPYHLERQLEFCRKHNLQAAYDSIINAEMLSELDRNYDSSDVKELLSECIKKSLDYLNIYNKKNKVNKDESTKPVIKSIYIINGYDPSTIKGITMEELADLCRYARNNKKSGIDFVYNEENIEDSKQRKIKLETIVKINQMCPGLIDCCGIGISITPEVTPQVIREIFNDLKEFSDKTGMKISITKFDSFMPPQAIVEMKKEGYKESEIRKYARDSKKEQLEEIAKLSSECNIEFNNITYSNATDIMDRKKTKINAKRVRNGLSKLETVYGGTFDNSFEKATKQDDKEEIQSFGHVSPIIREDSSFKISENDGIIEAKGENISNELTDMMNDRPPLTVENQYKKSEAKVYKKTPPTNSTPKTTSGGFANSPQLLIVIILSLLAIIAMIFS